MAEIDDLQIRLLRARLAEAMKAEAMPVIDPEAMTPEQHEQLPVPSIEGAIKSAGNVASNVMQVKSDIGEAGSEFISRGGRLLGNAIMAAAPPGGDVHAWARNQIDMLERAAQKRKGRFEAEKVGTGIGEFGREVLITLPSMVIGGGATLPARIVAGAARGGVVGALGPTPPAGNYTQQITTGAGIGAGLPVAMGAAARVVSPRASVEPNIQVLLKEGVTPSPGEIAGRYVRGTEDRARGLAVIGDAIQGARERTTKELNRAVLNRVLNPIGETLPQDIQIGRNAIEYAHNKAGAYYDNTLSRTTARPDTLFLTEVMRLKQAVPESKKSDFDSLLARTLIDRIANKQWSGDEIKKAVSELRATGSRYMKSDNATDRDYAEAVFRMRNTVHEMIARQNPAERGRLAAADKAWANLVIADLAAGQRGATEGVFTAAQLSSAVRAASQSASGGRKPMFAQGKARMQDLSDPAQAVLSPKQGNPGTAGTLSLLALLADAAAGGGIPYRYGGAALASHGAYSPWGVQTGASILARRPAGAPELAQSVRNLSPFLTPPAVSGNPWR